MINITPNTSEASSIATNRPSLSVPAIRTTAADDDSEQQARR